MRKAAAFEARKVSSSADPDDQWHLVARADEETRVVAVDDDESKMPFELAEREPHRLDEVALVVALDEVGHRLRVGLGGEGVAVGE